MRRTSLALGVVFLTSCSALVDLSGLGGGDAGDDAAPGDEAADATGDAGPTNLLVNGDFEETGLGCGPGWSAQNAALTQWPDSHSGAFSCQVCVSSPGIVARFSASPAPVIGPPIGATYFAQGWVKLMPDAAVASVDLLIVQGIANGSSTLGSQLADMANVSWQVVQAKGSPVTDAGKSVGYAFLVQPFDGGRGCVLVDDAELAQQ